MRVPIAIAVTSADLVLPAPDRHTPAAAVLPPPEELDLDGALAQTAGLLERHGHLVVLVPSWLRVSALRRLHTVRAILETDRIALVDVDLPPLGTALLVRQLRQLTVSDFSPGVLASAARLLTHYIYAGALLGSVAKLDRIPVGLKAHAKSWSPNAQFAVLANPTPTWSNWARAPARPTAAAPRSPGTRVRHPPHLRPRPAHHRLGGLRAGPRLAGPGRHGEPAARRLARLVGHAEARGVRGRHPGPLGALPARRLGPPRGVPLVRVRAHRRPLRLLRRPAPRTAAAPADGSRIRVGIRLRLRGPAPPQIQIQTLTGPNE